jgi:hypothetical protein
VSAKYGYLSGWCGRGSLTHERCAGAYGQLETACTCQCHHVSASVRAALGQVSLFGDAA